MKPHVVSMGLVVLLLAASAVCVGTRHTADQRREEASAAARFAGSTTDHVASQPDGVRKEGLRRKAEPQTLASRLRSILATANHAECTRALLAMAEDFTPDDWPLALDALVGIG